MFKPQSEKQRYLDSGEITRYVYCLWEEIPCPRDICHTYRYLRRNWYCPLASDALIVARFIKKNYCASYKGHVVSIFSRKLLQEPAPFEIHAISSSPPRKESKPVRFRRYNAPAS